MSLLAPLCALALLLSGCAARTTATTDRGPAAVAPARPAPHPFPRTQVDSVEGVIALSDQYFESGRRELNDGHLGAAKSAFDRALEVLLEHPGGTRADARLREHFDRMVERISAYELTALAQGDGFAEKTSEPASIDELLAISTFEQPDATEQTAKAVADDLGTIVHDIEIPLNKSVLSFVELYSGRFKPSLEAGLSRGARYLPMIQQIFADEGLPLDLAYVPLVESAFKPLALSRASARGLWQFMRGTGLENGLKYDWYVDERADPEKATRAAAKYLKTLYETFNDWHLALAAYNGGPGRVQRAMKSSGRSDFWSLASSGRYLPRETRDYVPLILAAIVVARSPTRYGMEVDPVPAPAHEVVTLTQAVDLRRVAEWTDTPVEDIQDLNPELRRWTTPIGLVDYGLRVPQGTAAIVAERLTQLGPEDLLPLSHYIVRKGDTLSGVAKRLKVSRTDLAEANYLSRESRLQIGQALIVPRAPALLAARTDAPTPDTPETIAGDRTAAVRTVAFASQNEGGTDQVVHRVTRGDTLFSIARRYRTSVALLKQWNALGSNLIQIGQRLTIFRSPATAAP